MNGAVTFGFVVVPEGPVAGLKVNGCLGVVLCSDDEMHTRFKGNDAQEVRRSEFSGKSFFFCNDDSLVSSQHY